ncbi:MAG: virulence RhuM family protein [Clostridiales bacterium]|nr:virulence RhuM family protein [Clostridiales bacterium]
MTDVYALSIDYEASSDDARRFFATVQNKLHFAIHGHTAAEIIEERADASKDNMGLTTWKGVKVRKADVIIAKNYLTEAEMKSLNKIVSMYLDYAEDQAERKNPMYMKDWENKINKFLDFNDREILSHAGQISKKFAEELASEEYHKFNQRRLDNSINEEDDFDRFVKENKRKK